MGTSGKPRPRSPRGEGETLRHDILTATTELITEGGGRSGLSLRAVARRTGVDTMMLYRHFDTLDAIVDEVQRQHYLRFTEALRDGVAESDDELAAFAHNFVEYGLSNPGPFRLMFATPLDTDRTVPDDKPILGEPALTLLVDLMRTHLADHEPRRDPWRAAISLWTGLHGIVHLRLSVGMRGESAWPPVESQIADALIPFYTAPLSIRP